MYNSVEELDTDYTKQESSNTDIYYATAGFGAENNGTAANAVAKRELYIDVDCGEGKPYLTQVEGLQALKAFVDVVGLPKPTLMDSGNGYHAHWFFDTPVPVHEWLPIATALKNKCVEHKFDVDGACTADTVRVLRTPGSMNSRGGKVSQLVNKLYFYTAELFRDLLEVKKGFDFAAARALTQSKGGVKEAWKFNDLNRTTRFETIWVRSMAGEGCAQIKHGIENASELPEPLWRAMLSIAQVCVDRDWAIHAVSNTHPQYEFDETEHKASQTRGPYVCETFQRQDTGHLCTDCPHIGKIKSPIQLGTEISTPNLPAVVEVAKENGEVTQIEIPSYPYPFERGEHGGLYYVQSSKDDKVDKVQVCPYDIYATGMLKSTDGSLVNMRLHKPHEEPLAFTIPQRDIANRDTLRLKLNDIGVPIFQPKQLDMFQWFMKDQIIELQGKERAIMMETRNGWTDRDTFIIGDREYTKHVTITTPIIGIASNLTRALVKKGSLEYWKQIINRYNNPESDMMAFGVLCGFGSVIMHMSKENGGVVNFYSKKSGSGKTTVLMAANSIFGHPKDLMSNVGDTRMSKAHRMGALNGMVVTLDEMTNATPEEISEALYNSTQGRARNRMQSKVNEERDNNTSWKCISLWTANTSMADRMSLLKLDPQGEMARMIEISLPHQPDSEVLAAKLIFDQLDEHYGLAADVLMPRLLSNYDTVRGYFDQVQKAVYALHPWTSMDRYRLNILICAITGGIIAKDAKLIDFNLPRIMRKIADHIFSGTQDIHAQTVKAVETFAAYVHKYASSMLEINNADINNIPAAPIREPHLELRIRWEPDTKSLFIGLTDFNRWCAEKQINTRELKDMFTQETAQHGGRIEVVKKRLGKGWKGDFGPVNAYEIKNARVILGIELDAKNYEPNANTAT